jgi:sugar lactone lactonase YvrE
MGRKASRFFSGRWVVALLPVAFIWAVALAGDNVTANLVLGQSSFSGSNSAAGQSGLSGPRRLAIDRNSTPNHLYVPDFGNNRVLGWYDVTALSNGEPADLLIGQVNFSGKLANQGNSSPTASRLSDPDGIAVDSQGNLYIGDAENNRVLEFNAPYAQFNHACTSANPCVVGAANLVFGQGSSGTNFTSGGAGNGTTGMFLATDVLVDLQGNVYVTDQGNNRVLFYLNPLATGVSCSTPGQPGCAGDVVPDRVFGQGASGTNFTDTSPGVGAALTDEPACLALDSNQNLYVADASNSRVLEFDNPTSTASCANPGNPGCAGDVIADAEFGQGSSGNDFTDDGSNAGATAFDFPFGIAVDPSNNLYVSDTNNNRVLAFIEPSSGPNNFTANVVFGQGASGANFGGSACVAAGTTTTCAPHGAAADANGNLYVADSDNNRVLVFDNPLTSGSSSPTPTPGNGRVSSPARLDFRSTGVGFTSSESFKVINRGSGTLAGSLEGVQPPFAITQGASFSLTHDQADPVTITFTPLTPHTFIEPVTVSSNDPKHPSVMLELSGEGLPGSLSVPSAVTFEAVSGSSTIKTIAIKNAGKGVLMVTVGSISGSPEFSFASAPPAGTSAIQPKGSISVMVKFAPSSKGAVQAKLAITSDDPHHASASIVLKGTGKH